jgi:hypothetical protein
MAVDASMGYETGCYGVIMLDIRLEAKNKTRILSYQLALLVQFLVKVSILYDKQSHFTQTASADLDMGKITSRFEQAQADMQTDIAR